MVTKYVIGATKQAYSYWYAGPAVGFTSIVESAIGYVSPEIAKMAAEVIDSKERRMWPNMLKLEAIKLDYEYIEIGNNRRTSKVVSAKLL